AFAIALLLRPSRGVLRAGILLNVGVVVLWAVSRVTGLPFGDDAWVAEPMTFPDTLATILEVVAVVGSYALLTGRLERRAMPRAAAVIGGVGMALALVGLTTASVAPALSGGDGHTHGAIGHTHGAIGHTHAHLDAAGGTGLTPGGHDHGAVATAGIESGNG